MAESKFSNTSQNHKIKTCVDFSRIISSLKPMGVKSVVEWGAGEGLWADIILHFFQPEKLWLLEIGEEATKDLKRKYRHNINVEVIGPVDAYKVDAFPEIAADMEIIGFEKWTFKKFLEYDEQAAREKIEESLLMREPRYFVFVDSVRIHWETRSIQKCYKKLFDVGEERLSYGSYLNKIAEFFRQNYRYDLLTSGECDRGNVLFMEKLK